MLICWTEVKISRTLSVPVNLVPWLLLFLFGALEMVGCFSPAGDCLNAAMGRGKAACSEQQ